MLARLLQRLVGLYTSKFTQRQVKRNSLNTRPRLVGQKFRSPIYQGVKETQYLDLWFGK